MRTTAFLLLTLCCSLSSATIYWMLHMDTVQSQANLVMFAHEHQDPILLYTLVDFDGTVDRYLASLHGRAISVDVVSANEGLGKTIDGVVKVAKEGKTYHAKLHLVPCSSSPTGYKINRAEACKTGDCTDSQ